MSNELINRDTDRPVLFQAHPFERARKVWAAPEGRTIQQVVDMAGLKPAYLPMIRVWVNDREIDRGLWGVTTLREGETVYIRLVPQGKSGKDILRSVLLVVVAIVAYYYAPVLFGGAAGGGAAGVTIGGVTGGFAAHAVVGLAAAGLVNPLIAAILMPLSSGMVMWGA